MNKCSNCNADSWLLYMVVGPIPEDEGFYVKCQKCLSRTEIYKTKQKES